MSLQTVLITGANRGLGLEMVRQLLASLSPPEHVIATTRQSSNEELDKLKALNPRLHVLKLETRDYQTFEEFIQSVEQIVGDQGIDTLINNAGIWIRTDELINVTPNAMITNLEVNSVAPLMLTKALLPLLKVCIKIKFVERLTHTSSH